MGEIDFAFADKKAPMNYCVKLAGKLQEFGEGKVQDIIKHMYIVDQLDKELT